MADTFRILAIDGGGARGIYPAHILSRIQQEYNVDYAKDFDIIAGTSTGSIIAAALACGIPIERVCDLYINKSKEIFRPGLLGMIPALTPKYPLKSLETVLKSEFQDLRMKDAKTNLIIPATDVVNGRVFVHKKPYSPEFVRDGETFVRDAVLSSCAAPVYFRPAKITNNKNEPYLLADGGLWANNPSLVAFIEAINPKRLNISPADIRILSIGTGSGKTAYAMNGTYWGAANWGVGLVKMILGLQSQSAHNMMGLLMDESNYLRIDFSKDKDLPLDSYREEFLSQAGQDFTYNAKKIEKFFNS